MATRLPMHFCTAYFSSIELCAFDSPFDEVDGPGSPSAAVIILEMLPEEVAHVVPVFIFNI